MTTTITDIRLAEVADAASLDRVHSASWRQAYTGIIPFQTLSAMIARRDVRWWSNAIKSGKAILVCSFGDRIVGYATVGRNRTPALPVSGEIYELYLDPPFQGVGIGRRLFEAARESLDADGAKTFAAWVLTDNERAMAFYKDLNGLDVAQGHETLGDATVSKVAFLWA